MIPPYMTYKNQDIDAILHQPLRTRIVAYLSTKSAHPRFDFEEFNTFFTILNLPLIIGWGLWWKMPGLFSRASKFYTQSGSEDKSRERLRRMLADGLNLLNKPVNTEFEFRKWKTDKDNWSSAVYREIRTGFNETLAESFTSLDGVTDFEIVSSFNGEHNSEKLLLNKMLNNLINIIK